MDEITQVNVDGMAEKKSALPSMGHVPVVIVGGGQAGLSVSHLLKKRGIEHVVLEKNRIGHAWRADRWDTFCLVTPNWQCTLPDFPYTGDDPDGFMVKDEIVAYIEAFAKMVDPPIHEGVAVTKITRDAEGTFHIASTKGGWTADNVVMAISGYHTPAIPRVGERLPRDLFQLHSIDYKNPRQIPEGEVMIVGTGQSGCQIAEDLHLAGRKVHLAVGDAPRSPRAYRGKDTIRWLDEMGYYETTTDTHPLGVEVRKKANHYFTGRNGGHEIDLRQFAAEGMKLYGMLDAVDGDVITFRPDLASNLEQADKVYLRIRSMIDDYIAKAGIDAPPAVPYAPPWTVTAEPTSLSLSGSNINAVIWSTGFRADFSMVDIPGLQRVRLSRPSSRHHHRARPVLHRLGWLWTWGSGRFSGVAADAAHIVEAIGTRHWAADSFAGTAAEGGLTRRRPLATTIASSFPARRAAERAFPPGRTAAAGGGFRSGILDLVRRRRRHVERLRRGRLGRQRLAYRMRIWRAGRRHPGTWLGRHRDTERGLVRLRLAGLGRRLRRHRHRQRRPGRRFVRARRAARAPAAPAPTRAVNRDARGGRDRAGADGPAPA